MKHRYPHDIWDLNEALYWYTLCKQFPSPLWLLCSSFSQDMGMIPFYTLARENDSTRARYRDVVVTGVSLPQVVFLHEIFIRTAEHLHVIVHRKNRRQHVKESVFVEDDTATVGFLQYLCQGQAHPNDAVEITNIACVCRLWKGRIEACSNPLPSCSHTEATNHTPWLNEWSHSDSDWCTSKKSYASGPRFRSCRDNGWRTFLKRTLYNENQLQNVPSSTPNTFYTWQREHTPMYTNNYNVVARHF